MEFNEKEAIEYIHRRLLEEVGIEIDPSFIKAVLDLEFSYMVEKGFAIPMEGTDKSDGTSF